MQVFMGRNEEELSLRCSRNASINGSVIEELQTMLHETHPYVHDLKVATEFLDSRPEMKLVIRADKTPPANILEGSTLRRPAKLQPSWLTKNTAPATLFSNTEVTDCHLSPKPTAPTTVFSIHSCFCVVTTATTSTYNRYTQQLEFLCKKVSCKAFYAYRMMVRDNDFNKLLRFKDVTNQFFVDMYAKIESKRLFYICTHQRSSELLNTHSFTMQWSMTEMR
ncbi:uncharacterized protein LOC115209900 isoform X1 [Octopus sinensis]|uniref:Uncharacterized protein LOC115209900 isoform X1 n=1 Tax=Octopus sinensis TaxID=2607531 RepID=A0A7E6EPN3_9MOLL|nr:uncharacterized protein LOC115209900 isoform X1 [Octopus sinensis]